MQTMTFVAACKSFFGLKSGQTSIEFMKELRDLTTQDRNELTAMFPTVGYTIPGAAALGIAA